MRKYGHDETRKKIIYEKGTCMGIFSDFTQKTRSSFSGGSGFYVQVSFNEIESLLRSSIKQKCDNRLHIDLHILYFHQIESVTILQNTLNQKMFRCHILVYYSN